MNWQPDGADSRLLTAVPTFKEQEVYWSAVLPQELLCPTVYELVDHLLVTDWQLSAQTSAEWLRPYLGPLSRSYQSLESSGQRLGQLFDLAIDQSLLPWVSGSKQSCSQLDQLLGPADWAAIDSGHLETVPDHYRWLSFPTGIPVLAKAVLYERVAPLEKSEKEVLRREIKESSRAALDNLLEQWLEQ